MTPRALHERSYVWTCRAALRAVMVLALVPAVARGNGIEGRVVVPSARDQRDTVVYIEKIPGKSFAPPAAPVVMDQVSLVFQPHVLPVLVGTRVAFPNSDEVRHNVFSPTRGARFDLGSYPRLTTKVQTFDKPGVVTLLCNVHAEMSAYVIVAETPYFAVSDKDGRFVMPDVPPGRYVVTAWHERTAPASRTVEVLPDQRASVAYELRR